jgi:AraC-like DNA-binding protein
VTEHLPRSGLARISFRSGTAAEVERFAAEHYAAASVHDVPGGRGFELGHETLAAPGFSLSEMWLSLGLDALVDPVDEQYVVDHVRGGRMLWETEAFGTLRLGPGDIAVMPPSGRFHDRVEEAELDVAALDARLVAELAEQVHGIPAERFRLTGLLPVSRGHAHEWDRTVVHVRDRLLGNPMLVASPILLDAALRMLVGAFLVTFPNTVLTVAARRNRASIAAPPARVTRETVDYLRTHAGSSVGPLDLVRLTGVPARDAAAGLRRAGADPAEVLWRSRLDGARRDLVAGDLVLTPDLVDRIAARWGFARPDRFRITYTREYGETPERTARR